MPLRNKVLWERSSQRTGENKERLDRAHHSSVPRLPRYRTLRYSSKSGAVGQIFFYVIFCGDGSWPAARAAVDHDRSMPCSGFMMTCVSPQAIEAVGMGNDGPAARREQRPPAHPQPGSVERNGHAFMALTRATVSASSRVSGPGEVGRGTTPADRAQICRRLTGSAGFSAAQRQYASDPRQISGQGQFGQLILSRRCRLSVISNQWKSVSLSLPTTELTTAHEIATVPPTGSLV